VASGKGNVHANSMDVETSPLFSDSVRSANVLMLRVRQPQKNSRYLSPLETMIDTCGAKIVLKPERR
jgi:hypothetical protein